ncbi:hypothetical protein BROUX41_006180 [Berkeleyomyces rouxiae]|uniref:uncharacterized protein n=1 Tax=Berkeleyomyces rouxiae TaxID=2035830 RepID=UPI003B7BA272
MPRNLFRPAHGLTCVKLRSQLAACSRALSTTSPRADDTPSKPPSARASPPNAAPRLPRSAAAASEISSMLRSSASTPPPGARPIGTNTPGSTPGANHTASSGAPRVVNVRSLPRGRGGLRLGGGALGSVVRNPDGTVSVRRLPPTARIGGPGAPQNRSGGPRGSNSEGVFRTHSGGRGGPRGGTQGGRSRDGGRRKEDGRGAGKSGGSGGKKPMNEYQAMAEEIDWYAPYTKEELQILSERVPAAPERKAETFVPKLGVDELLEYAPALATDSNILGKAATIRQTLKTIAGGPIDPGHLAHPKMMAAKYDYRGVMYFEKLETKELLEQRANIKIKLGPDARLKDVLVRRTVKGQYEPMPAVPQSDVLQMTRNYHLKANTYHSSATDKFHVKLEEMLAKVKPKQAARST